MKQPQAAFMLRAPARYARSHLHSPTIRFCLQIRLNFGPLATDPRVCGLITQLKRQRICRRSTCELLSNRMSSQCPGLGHSVFLIDQSRIAIYFVINGFIIYHKSFHLCIQNLQYNKLVTSNILVITSRRLTK